MQKTVHLAAGAAAAERVYSLDALRAIMMLLGIVIHAAITYGSIDYGRAWSMKDPDNSMVFDLIVAFIHSFRMPVFFVAAGFFCALLFYKKGPGAMIQNRIKRIVFPFAAGVLVTFPLIVFAFTFSIAAFAGAAAPLQQAWQTLVSGRWLPFNVVHLWFLYFLAMYSVSGWVLGLLFQKQTAFTTGARSVCSYLLKNFWLRLLVMIVFYFACLYWMGSSSIKTNNKWEVDPSIFTTYFLFFGTGWLIYATDSLARLAGYPLVQLGVATVLFFYAKLFPWPDASWVLLAKQGFTAVYGSLFIFGFIAFFIRYFSHYSKSLTYQMDAAYWVYIIHLPVVSFIPGLLAGIAWPAGIKFFITLAATTFICFLSYKYLVRGTFIGMFLNGKVYKQKKHSETNAARSENHPVNTVAN